MAPDTSSMKNGLAKTGTGVLLACYPIGYANVSIWTTTIKNLLKTEEEKESEMNFKGMVFLEFSFKNTYL